jgi:hypothetical protein
MIRLLGLSALVLLASTGCRMCACPYDYCGPVVECGCVGGEGCGMSQGPVEGQIQDGTPVDGEMIQQGAPQSAPTPANGPMSSNGAPWRHPSPTLASR